MGKERGGESRSQLRSLIFQGKDLGDFLNAKTETKNNRIFMICLFYPLLFSNIMVCNEKEMTAGFVRKTIFMSENDDSTTLKRGRSKKQESVQAS